ncbi:MAG: aminotransferase class I/II-fold pyridoxal phosphate-dependent enzyme [Oligoflexia bacterium]|nr:aminotransferase class I/II-fold pyridoxal phosphate-dependent enzyme [Oligoflexia bacterium]
MLTNDRLIDDNLTNNKLANLANEKLLNSLGSFVKDRYIQKAALLKSQNLYPYFRSIEETDAINVIIGNKKHVMIGSNNYLGLTHHPYVQEMAIKATERYGTGCTGSRFLNGNFAIHEELEEKLAKFIGHEASLVYATGMQVNLGTLSSIVGPRDCAFSDMENHASIIDGLRLGGKTYKYKHNNMAELEDLVSTYKDRYEKIVIVTDGVFSMTGGIANLPEIVRIAKKHGALIYVDDAHGLGVLGNHGRGTVSHYGINTQDVHFNMSTFSKSFASIGGFVSGSKEAIDYVRHVSRSFIFSAALPPSAVATALACIDLISKDDSFQKRLESNARFMREGFLNLGFDILNSETPIIPIFVGDDVKAMKITMFLHHHGVFATPVIAPATAPGMALLRTSYSAAHEKSDLQFCLEIFEKVKKEFGINKADEEDETHEMHEMHETHETHETLERHETYETKYC